MAGPAYAPPFDLVILDHRTPKELHVVAKEIVKASMISKQAGIPSKAI